MKTGAKPKNRQGGAVAIMVGISLVLLVGFLALVMDLSRLYLARTGLQNAADAAALSGAKQLDGTAARICCDADSAVAWAIRTGGGPDPDGQPNNTFFGSGLSQGQVDVGALDSSNNKVSFSASPTGPWLDIASAQASPGDKFFVKVDTASGIISPLFAIVWNIFNMGAFGTAVAGPLMANVAPMGICALDVTTSGGNRACAGPGSECGFLRGVAYNIIDVNPLTASSYPIWLNPVDIPPGNCDPNHASANYMRPFVCEGKANVGAIPGTVYANTGGSSGLDTYLNSRFDVFTGGSKCDATTAPPDTNIKEYAIGGGANQGRPRDWMEPGGNTLPTQQGITIDLGTHMPVGYPTRPANFADWGALWSYARERNWSTGADYGLSDWPTLYGGSADTGANGYPASGAPYQQGSGKYFDAPNPSRQGRAGRRVLNLLILDCGAPGFPIPGPGASCAQLKSLAVGKFFMPVKADLPSSVYGEFAGLLPASLIKKQYILYQ